MVDAEAFTPEHFESEAALQQITYTDITILNKTDLASPEQLETLEAYVGNVKTGSTTMGITTMSITIIIHPISRMMDLFRLRLKAIARFTSKILTSFCKKNFRRMCFELREFSGFRKTSTAIFFSSVAFGST